jgi:hypothetical protein
MLIRNVESILDYDLDLQMESTLNNIWWKGFDDIMLIQYQNNYVKIIFQFVRLINVEIVL